MGSRLRLLRLCAHHLLQKVALMHISASQIATRVRDREIVNALRLPRPYCSCLAFSPPYCCLVAQTCALQRYHACVLKKPTPDCSV